VKQPRAVEHGQLVGGARQNFESESRVGSALQVRLQALAFDYFPNQVRPTRAGQAPELDDPRHSEPFQAAQGDGFTHESRHLALARFLRQHLERVIASGAAVPDGPHLATAAAPEAPYRFVALRKL